MFRPLTKPISALGLRSAVPRRCLSTIPSVKKASDPLRILFCGSDAFSCESLCALHGEHVRNRKLVESLDVMVLPPKRTGRGFKQIREVPCKSVAEELGLRIHQRETFRNWELPQGINLVVVVSFGLFVPPRILNSAKYGGLNVHPSLLPDLRGPAPIHHAMLRGDKHIGISLQTLDHKAFDHGTILAQTPAPGLPVPPSSSIEQLTKALSVAGAQMLVQGLRDGLHVPPHADAGWMASSRLGTTTAAAAEGGLVHAPKVTKADAQVDWARWTLGDFRRRTLVFTTVWTRAVSDRGEVKRVIFQDAEPVAAGEDAVRGVEGRVVFVHESGKKGGTTMMERHERAVRVDEATGSCFVKVLDGDGDGDDGWIRLRRVKVDGKPEQAAALGLRTFIQKA